MRPAKSRSWFTTFAKAASRAAGRPAAFGAAVAIIFVWSLCGPVFSFSDTWQLVINTSTTIVTFLMVFLIQRGQNKDAMAIQLKLNELVAAVNGASNRRIDVEDLTEDELQALHRYYSKLSKLAKKDSNIAQSHSVEEARTRHREKTATGS